MRWWRGGRAECAHGVMGFRGEGSGCKVAALERRKLGRTGCCSKEENEEGLRGGGGVSVVGTVVVNAGHCALAGSRAAKPWQLVSLCVTDLIDHKLYTPPSLPPFFLFPVHLMIHASCSTAQPPQEAAQIKADKQGGGEVEKQLMGLKASS